MHRATSRRRATRRRTQPLAAAALHGLKTMAGLAVLLALLSGCELPRSTADEDPFTVQDSAGVELATSTAPAASDGAGWTVAPDPVLVLGPEEPVPLHAVSGAARLSDGRVAVLMESPAAELHLFADDGSHEAIMGGLGEGPGEFRTAGWLGLLPGDTLAVWDYLGRRLSRFAPGGEVVDAATVPLSLEYWPSRVTDEGEVLFRASRENAPPPAGTGMYWDSTWVVRYAPAEEEVDTIARLPNGQRPRADEAASRQHFTPSLRMTPAPGGGVRVGWGEQFQVHELAPDGTLRRVIRRTHEPVQVTDEVLSEYERSYRTAMENSPSDPGSHGLTLEDLVERHRSTPHRSELPAFSALRTDPDGRLWAEHYTPTYGRQFRYGAEWSVFDPDGRWLDTVRTPEGLDVQQIGSDFVLGLHTDEFGLESVRVYALER